MIDLSDPETGSHELKCKSRHDLAELNELIDGNQLFTIITGDALEVLNIIAIALLFSKGYCTQQ